MSTGPTGQAPDEVVLIKSLIAARLVSSVFNLKTFWHKLSADYNTAFAFSKCSCTSGNTAIAFCCSNMFIAKIFLSASFV